MTRCKQEQELSTGQHNDQTHKILSVSLNNAPGQVIHINDNNRIENDRQLPEEILIEKYSAEKNEAAVIKALYAGIVKYAKMKKFIMAERLRSKLIEIAPMALTEIVRSSEILEQEQTAAMDPQKMIPFSHLYESFSQSESVVFYFALKNFTAKANAHVFEQCKFDHRLYFIHSGRLILSYYDTENRQNIDFAILQKGDIAGVDAFLTFTGHGTTLTPIEDSQISYLEKSEYTKIINAYPAIETKLIHFCESHKKTCRIDASRRQARRFHQRYPVSLQGHVQKINSQGKLADETTRITVADISAGGLCYTVQNMKPAEAASIHKNYILISASYKIGPTIREFKKLARVVSLKFHPFGECSVHVQFKTPIKNEKILEIAENNPESPACGRYR